MTDCKGRKIDNRILEVCVAELDEKPWDARKNGYFVMLASEFFLDGSNPESHVPAMFARQSNSKYFGWQKVALFELDKDAYRPEGQKKDVDGPVANGVDRYAISEAGYYDGAMSRVIWYRYIQDESDFLNHSKTIHAGYSEGVKRLILENMGFQYCGKRAYLQTTYRNMLGYVGHNYSCEIWAHPNGVIAQFSVVDEFPMFHECAITCKFDGTYNDIYHVRLTPSGGSMSYNGGKCPGTLIKYQSAPRNLRGMIDHPWLISHWGEGMDGFKNLSMWSYLEEDYFDGTLDEFFEYHRNDVCRICKDIPLLKSICFD